MNEEKSYPAVQMMLSFGKPIAWVMGLACAVCGISLSSVGLGWGWSAGGVVGGIVMYFFVRILTELIEIIAATLLPQ